MGPELTQDQDRMKRRNDNHSPGPVIRELVPSSNMTNMTNAWKKYKPKSAVAVSACDVSSISEYLLQGLG